MIYTEPNGTCEITLVERLRYDVYCEEKRYLDPQEYPDQLERDILDPHSIQRAIISSDPQNPRALSCYRLIKANPTGLPVESEFDLCEKTPCLARTVEISRLIFSQEVRANPPLAELLLEEFCRDLYRTCEANGYKWCYAIVERQLLVLLRRRFGLQFAVLGEPKLYMNTLNYPALLDMEMVAKPVYQVLCERIK